MLHSVCFQHSVPDLACSWLFPQYSDNKGDVIKLAASLFDMNEQHR
jgi:hypothetical protein